MKKLLTLLLSFTIVTVGFAQGNGNGKAKQKKDKASKHKNKSDNRYENDDNTGIFGGRNNDVYNNQGKSAKNQPAKVRAAFQRDYPNATNVSWTKSQGDWTATFNHGGLFNSRTSATYHSNGQRKDGGYTTTQGRQAQGSVLDRILKRNPSN